MVETSLGYGRGLLRGIAKYSKLHGPWNFYRELPFYAGCRQGKYDLAKLKNINPDGAIIREPIPALVRHFKKVGIPLIISPNLIDTQIPTIRTNGKKIARLAAEHFIDRGFKNFAYCGFEEMHWSKSRYENFEHEIKSRNYHLHHFFATVNKLVNPQKNDLKKILNWLRDLPKPVGLMACNDDMGQIILDICKLADFHVPEQIAVLGIDDDQLTCELTDPSLSSIALNSEKCG